MSDQFNVAFDEAHKPRGLITGNYGELKDHLESNGFACHSFMEFPITRQNLGYYDILVIPCPDNAQFSSDEIEAISTWVKEDGGGLVMMSHAGGDKGRRTNLSDLAEKFGMSFENDQVLDKENNFGLENLPAITKFIPPHPITDGLESICFRAGCSLSSFGGVPVIISSEEANPFSSPLLVAVEHGDGKVVGIGSYEIFRDKIMGGFQTLGHGQLATNTFNWVKTEYRSKLKSGEIEPKIAYSIPKQKSQPNIQGMGTHSSDPISSEEIEGQNTLSSSGAYQKLNLTSDVKISEKSDLANLLYMLLNEADILKQQIQTIIDNVVASEEQIIDMQKATEAEMEAASEKTAVSIPETGNSDEKVETEEEEPPPIKKDLELTALPKKPFEDEQKEEPKLSPEEIRTEFEMLQSKISSIQDLKTLVNNKYKSKKFTKQQKDKQIKRLERDESKAVKRMEELTKILNNL
jgi:hypothetical protein